MRLRSILEAIPADLEAALASPADAILLSLAAQSDGGDLREAVRAGIARIREAGKAALVTVNHPRTRLLRDDLDAILNADLAGVLLPHAVEPQDVRDLAVALREFELQRAIEPGTVVALPIIDTARGLARALEIAAAAPRVAGLVFDTGGYARDIGGRYEEHGPRLAYARGAVVAAARATDGLPVVRTEGFELAQLGHYGFAGAVITLPGRVAAANLAFTPTEGETAWAERATDAYTAARAESALVARVDGQVIDAHTARHARRILDQSERAQA